MKSIKGVIKLKKKILLAFLTALLLLTIVLTGCGSSGIPQAQYDQATAQLADAQSKLTKAQSDLAALQTDKTKADTDLKAAQAQVADFEKQVADLKLKYEFTGMTTEQKVTQMIKNYHETHTYSKIDLFVCGDMSAEVWNLLKTQGINAKMVVGSINAHWQILPCPTTPGCWPRFPPENTWRWRLPWVRPSPRQRTPCITAAGLLKVPRISKIISRLSLNITRA